MVILSNWRCGSETSSLHDLGLEPDRAELAQRIQEGLETGGASMLEVWP